VSERERPRRKWRWLVAAVLLLLAGTAVSILVLRARVEEPHPPWQFRERGTMEKLLIALGLRHRGFMANDTAAIATLRNITSAQAQFQATAIADEDNDAEGEYGVFQELSGAVIVRGRDRPINPPVLSGAFRTVDRSGRAGRSGFYFLMFLPGPEGKLLPERTDGGYSKKFRCVSEEIDVDLAEQAWFCVAFPVKPKKSGSWCYLVTQNWEIYGRPTLPDPLKAAVFDAEAGGFVPAGEGWIPVD